MVFRLFLLNPFNGIFIVRRNAHKYHQEAKKLQYIGPRPRSYKRRLHEAVLAPILPKQLEKEWKKAKDPFNLYSAVVDEQIGPEEFTKYELALVGKLRGWINSEQFRVMAICQINSTKEENLWLAKNKFRLNGIEFCAEQAKILRKLFQQSRLRSVTPLLVDECTGLLFGKDPEQCCYQMMVTSNAYAWIQPIAFVVDSRILSIDFVSELSSKDSLMKLRCQTAQTLDRTLRQIPSTMDLLVQQITRTLDSHLKLSNEQ